MAALAICCMVEISIIAFSIPMPLILSQQGIGNLLKGILLFLDLIACSAMRAFSCRFSSISSALRLMLLPSWRASEASMRAILSFDSEIFVAVLGASNYTYAEAVPVLLSPIQPMKNAGCSWVRGR
jgi:hypothetical protein